MDFRKMEILRGKTTPFSKSADQETCLIREREARFRERACLRWVRTTDMHQHPLRPFLLEAFRSSHPWCSTWDAEYIWILSASDKTMICLQTGSSIATLQRETTETCWAQLLPSGWKGRQRQLPKHLINSKLISTFIRRRH